MDLVDHFFALASQLYDLIKQNAEKNIAESLKERELFDEDYRPSRGIDKALVASLACCEWVRQQLIFA